MENPIYLTKDEEFWMMTGVVLRNWTALQIGLNESRERLEIIRSKVNSLLQSTIDGVLKIKANKCDWGDVADFLDSYVCEQFDVILDDDSDSEVVCHLIDLHSLVETNDRAAIISAMGQFQDHRHVLSGELYQPKRVIQKDGASCITVNSSQINAVSTGSVQPSLRNLPSMNYEGSVPMSGASTAQYTVFNPSSAATAVRNTKLDQPEGSRTDEAMSSDSDEAPSLANSNDVSNSRKLPENSDEWMVVERRKKKK